MTTLKEATNIVHRQAEQTSWAKLLLTGKITQQQYASHLVNRLAIHQTIEDRITLHKNILRSDLIQSDLNALNSSADIAPQTKAYIEYLTKLTEHELRAHVYVHYLGELFGGQYIKTVITFPCAHLDFDNIFESITYIRELSNAVDHNEAIRAFEFIIKIYEQLWETHK
jgi:heme oxygenase